jgi:hypothetical protein
MALGRKKVPHPCSKDYIFRLLSELDKLETFIKLINKEYNRKGK